jgi:hypothetical protein
MQQIGREFDRVTKETTMSTNTKQIEGYHAGNRRTSNAIAKSIHGPTITPAEARRVVHVALKRGWITPPRRTSDA